MSPKDISRMQSEPRKDQEEKDTTSETLMTTVKIPISSLSTSTFKPYSGDLPMQKTTISSLNDLHLSDMGSVSLTKKEPKIEVVGDPSMEPQTKKKSLRPNSNLEVTQEERPQTQTLQSPLTEAPKKKNLNLQPLPNSSLLISVNHPSNPTLWLEQWHNSQPPPPSPQTAWWPEPWELEYPEEGPCQISKESSSHYSPHNTVEEMEVEMILLNLTDKILENARAEGREVVEMEITQGVAEAEEEANLILRAMTMRPTQGHYQIN